MNDFTHIVGRKIDWLGALKKVLIGLTAQVAPSVLQLYKYGTKRAKIF